MQSESKIFPVFLTCVAACDLTIALALRNIHVHVPPTRLPQHIDKDCLKHLCGTNCCVFTAHTKSSTFNKFNYENI